ncbi:MAG: HPr(Ser) kinase/phosphatase [Elusimicrobia bacterium]|nr:HPr(Ser) kinase/phosphatase [Elusimicrobiota bacterium]
MSASLSVAELLEQAGAALKLELLCGEGGLSRSICVYDLNRPGLALAGALEHFRPERIQIIGKGEHAYCQTAPEKEILPALKQMLAHPDLPCLILTHGLMPPPALTRVCREFHVALLRTSLDTATFVGELTTFLEEILSPTNTVHGVLVNIYGLGVLIQGDSGIGKSECALELLKRGHILVADDVIFIRQKRGGVLLGMSPLSKDKDSHLPKLSSTHYIEVRGLGIIDVRMLFGIGAILDRSPVELVVQLELWNPDRAYDRLGIDEQTVQILGAKLPRVTIPVSPGRNLAVLIEVAALNCRLRSQGYVGARILNEDLIRKMRAQREKL